MSQLGYMLEVTAPAAQFFSEALVQNAASAMYNIPMQVGLGAMGRRSVIQAIEAIADEKFGPGFQFFSSKNGFTTNPDTDKFISRFEFTDSMGEQLGNPQAGLFRWYIDGLSIPYYDEDSGVATVGQVVPTVNMQTLHVILNNTSATAKAARAAAAGRCFARFWLNPMTSY